MNRRPLALLARSIVLSLSLAGGLVACEDKGDADETVEEDVSDREDEGSDGDAEERCDEYAESVYEDCVEDGGDEDDCGARAEAAFARV